MSVRAELTNRSARSEIKGWILYDGECSICQAWVTRLEAPLTKRGFEFAPLQASWVQQRLALPQAERLSEMRVVTAEGEVFGGADAVIELARQVWWAWPFYLLAHLPGAKGLLRSGYRRFARSRNCSTGACKLRSGGELASADRSAFTAWLPLIVLPLLTLAFASGFTPWVFMWLLAFAIFFGCKWLTLATALRDARTTTATRAAGFLLAWPGMHARAFLDPMRRPPVPTRCEWNLAFTKTLLGAVLAWCGARFLWPLHPLLAGWAGMIGIILCLHFGTFHLLSLLWRKAGVDAPPLMRAPIRATSLAEFWGSRWNRGFSDLAERHLFGPLAKRLGVLRATLAVFVVSGLLHELVISLPARGGYGLPTTYFLIQGFGRLCERTRAARRLGLGRGWRGWLFTLTVTAGPACWLFHPPFVNHVMLPFLKAIGAI